MIFNNKVVSIVTGEKPKRWQIIVRFFCRMIPFDVFSFISVKPRGWHDSISKTMIVNARK
jgi:hypothetical protein